MYKAVVLGGSGAVGGCVLRELALSPKCTTVTSLGRRQMEFKNLPNNTKFTHYTIDLENLEAEAEKYSQGHQIAYCTLGVGRPSRVPKEELYKVDVGYATAFAKGCKKAGVNQFILLGAAAADKDSRTYYLRYKGEVEENIKNLSFDRASFYRPSLLVTQEMRYGLQDSITQWVFPKISWFLPNIYHEIKIEDLARAMRINSELPITESVQILHYPDYMALIKKEEEEIKAASNENNTTQQN